MKRGRYYNRLSDAEKLKIIKLHQQGVKQIYIAERFGVHSSTISTVIRKYKREGDKKA